MRPLSLLAGLVVLAGCAGPSAPAPPPAAPAAEPPPPTVAPPPPTVAPPPAAAEPAPPAATPDDLELLTTPGALEQFVADGGELDGRLFLMRALTRLDGAERDAAVDRLLAVGADPTDRIVVVTAARLCATGPMARFLEAGADPNVCLEREGPCFDQGGLGGVVFGRRPYAYARDALDGIDADDPGRPACEAVLDLLAPLTPLR